MIVSDVDGIDRMLEGTKRIAVLGIKTEAKADQAAYRVPLYMQQQGYEVVPVPVYFPDATEILGQKVFRSIAAIPGPIDMVNVFRRPEDIDQHVDDIIAAKPKYVWFQLGIRNDAAAKRLSDAGITVLQDRCILVEHRRWAS